MPLQELVIRHCEMKCTSAELAAKGRELGSLIQKHDKVTQEKKDTVAAFKVQLDELDSDLRNLARVVTTGIEMRPVECGERFNRERELVETYRIDTTEIVANRPMTADEAREARQVNLELVPPKIKPLASGPFDGDGEEA